jgi:hypothetical protein
MYRTLYARPPFIRADSQGRAKQTHHDQSASSLHSLSQSLTIFGNTFHMKHRSKEYVMRIEKHAASAVESPFGFNIEPLCA